MLGVDLARTTDLPEVPARTICPVHADHASKDVRAGEMSRDKAVELVRHHDPIKPKDLKRWLDYVGMEEDAFDRIADTFRDPRVWAFQDGEWIKANLWD